MQRWYTVKVKYTKEVEKNGEPSSKNVNEAYLLPAVSCTDAETIITKEMSEKAQGEFLVHAMSITEVTDIFRGDAGGQWYQCKIEISEEDDRGKTHITKQNYMVEAFSCRDAEEKLDAELKDAMFDYELTSNALTKIVDVLYEDLDVEVSRTPAESSAE